MVSAIHKLCCKISDTKKYKTNFYFVGNEEKMAVSIISKHKIYNFKGNFDCITNNLNYFIINQRIK